MKKKILTLLTGTMLVASVGMAAPLTDLQKGDSNIGYNHYNLNSVDDDSFYLEHGIGDKLIVGLERNAYSYHGNGDAKSTDIYAQYKLDQNVRLIVGNRDNSDESKMFYGLGASTNLAPKLDGYASVITNTDLTEWNTGVAYKLDNKTSLHLGYKSSKEDGASRADGLGFGANYQF